MILYSSYFNVNDLIRLLIIYLSIFLILLSSYSLEDKLIKKYVWFSLIRIRLFFLSSLLFILFILFELSLYPILLIIVGWGYQFERIQRSKFIFFYTIVCRIPIFVGVIIILQLGVSFFTSPYSIRVRGGLLLILVGAFFVKLPVFTLHLWLPKAHVEAPTVGSIILAGLLLKLGVYGLARLFLLFKRVPLAGIWLGLLVGGLYGSISSFLIRDSKALVAYRSVAHINFILISILTITGKGVLFTLFVLFRHGIISTLLFFVVGNIFQIYFYSYYLLFKE